MIYKGIPVIGFAAWSGTGKTTLLTRVIPILVEHGLRTGVIKHVHHAFDIDKPGKDSYKLRASGASQIVASSNRRLAFIREFDKLREDPQLADALDTLYTDELDLILVEGYKHESFPKVEVHRASLGKPLMFLQDSSFVAIASDSPIESAAHLTQLDMNKPEDVAAFVLEWCRQQSSI